MVHYTSVDGLAHLVLNRPAQLNAMTPEMVDDIRAAVGTAATDGSRVLLISAAGRGFCAGRDIAGAEPGQEDGGEVLAGIFNPLMQQVADLPFPTIAAVQGACLGTGLGLALACDVVLAADNAKFGSPFGKIGAVFDSGGHKVFVERLGTAVTLDLIYSGRFLSGAEAAALGLVSRVVPADELASTATAYAAALASGPVLAFAESKRIVREVADTPTSLAKVLDLEAQAQSRASRTADYVEGFTAFLERRAPVFRGQ
ncbi:MAG: enoyl-CoA hydratase/isomerase family protein [Actinomycetales bacterium]|nr:enoyl-CoA hydratase/isomerase family protein [Actinomycetales bacterium]